MAEPSQELIDIDPDFEPLSRPRSCTWPLPRPEFNEPDSSNTSSPASSVKQEPGNGVDYISNQSLLEETEDVADEKTVVLCRDFLDNCCHPLTQQHQRLLQHQLSPQLPRQQQQVPPLSPPNGSNSIVVPFQKKGASSRRNAWGNMSYADLISKAIESSPEKRLTLSQIYDWMVQSVPYFKDKGDSNSSAGWKNSIRHNLSLHSRFVRIQNEGTGKSSWWMLNPDGSKSGKPPRRRAASMDNNSKFAKSRGRAAKKKVSLQGVMDEDASSPVSQYSPWLGGSPNSHSNDTFEEWTSFRGRASSDASTLSGRRSPFLPEPDDLSEGGDAHLGYPVASGAKMVTPLPSLAEVAGSLGHRSPENTMMEGLLNNLNLLSPKNQHQDTSHGSPMMQSSIGYRGPYALPSAGPPPHPPPEYPKSLYSQTPMNNGTSVPMRPLSETKVGAPGMGRFLGHYNNPEAASREPPLLCMETMVSHAGVGGRGGFRTLYSGQGHLGHVGNMAGPAPTQPPHPHHHPHSHTLPHQYPPEVHRPLNPAAVSMNGHGPQVLGHTDGSGCLGSVSRTYTLLGPAPPLRHSGGTPSVHHGNRNGFVRPRPNQHPAHLTRPERLPSDLDGMSIERFECDMETVLHETFMDGDAVDFTFDPMGMSQGLA